MSAINIQRSARGGRDANGYNAVIEVLLSGLGGDPERRIFDALNHPDVPSYGEQHPVYPGIQVVSQEAEAVDVKTIRVVSTYRVPSEDELTESDDGGSVELAIDSSVASESTSEDADGNTVVNFYSGIPGVAGSPTAIFSTREVAEFEYLRPQLSVRAVRFFNSMPVVFSTDLIATVNADPWSGFPAGTWLVSGIRSEPQSGRWRTTIELTYRRDGWKEQHRIRVFGEFPQDAVIGNGIVEVDLLRPVPFTQLGFTLPR